MASLGVIDPGVVIVPQAVTKTLQESGLHAALALLNARTRFRFSGIYRTEPPLLRNIALYDRENPSLNVSGARCPLDGTFCLLVWETNAPWSVADATADAALSPYTSQGAVLSYAGVPIRDRGGLVVGTLCHYDSRPRLLPSSELAVLDAVAAVIVPYVIEARRGG